MTENKDMKHTLFKKQDLILIAVVLAAAALLFLGTKLMHKSPAEVVEISVDGNVVETLDLAKDQELTIDGASGGTNHLIIKDGEVFHQVYRGELSDDQFYQKISATLTMLATGGERR